MRFLREGLALLAGVVGFVLGALGSLAVLMRLLTPDGDCQSPCDGPAYIAMWIGVFVAPVVGVICGGLAYCGMAYWNKRQ
jgi:hypothetical protein